MKTFLLYSAATALTPDHYVVRAPGGALTYVRAEVFNGEIDRALDAANPLDGETVLNSVVA